MRKTDKSIVRKLVIETTKCPVCSERYESGRSACPTCGTANVLWESPEYMRFEVELEKALYRTLQTWAKRKRLKTDEALVEILEKFLTSRENRG